MQAEIAETESTLRLGISSPEAYGHRPNFRLRFGTTGRREAANVGFRALAPRLRGLRRKAEKLCAVVRFRQFHGFAFEELRFAYI